jgi:hypothetical protein
VEPPEVVGREVEAGRDALVPEGLEKVGCDIAVKRRLHNVEVRRFRIEHAEAGVMLGGEHDVADAGKFGERGYVPGIEFVRIECLRQIVEEPVREIVRSPHQRVADDDAELAIYAPVDKQAEALVAEPFETRRIIFSLSANRRTEKDNDRGEFLDHCTSVIIVNVKIDFAQG